VKGWHLRPPGGCWPNFPKRKGGLGQIFILEECLSEQKTGGGGVPRLNFPGGKGGRTGLINGKGEATHPNWHLAAQLILTASAHGAADPIRLIVPGHRGAACSAGWICRGKAMKAFNQAARDGNLKVMLSGFDRTL
jgi:hypothetical protein